MRKPGNAMLQRIMKSNKRVISSKAAVMTVFIRAVNNTDK